MDASKPKRSAAPARTRRSTFRLTNRARAQIHADAVDFVARRYRLSQAEREALAAVLIRWRRGTGASAYYPRAAHGLLEPHILLRVAPGTEARWHTYRRARARYATPPGGIPLCTRILATAVLVHELTHAVQHGACGHERRKFSEVETTENEIEFVRGAAPDAFAMLVPVVRRAPRRGRRRAAPPSALAALRAIVLRAAGSLAGLIRRPEPALPPPRSRRRGRSPKPTGS